MAELTMYRGDTRTVVLTLEGAATFEVGDTVWFTAKRSASDPDDDAVIQITGNDVTIDGGTASVTIPPATTATLTGTTELVYDWQVASAGGAVHTVDGGTLKVLADVTRSTS